MMHAHQRSVTVDRLKLIERLKLNLSQHKMDYAEAVVGYRIKLITDLTDKLGRIQGMSAEGAAREKAVPFVPPQSFEKDYVDAIAMLEWSISDTIDLDQSLFKCYVQDEWTWSQNFEVASTMYKSVAAALR